MKFLYLQIASAAGSGLSLDMGFLEVGPSSSSSSSSGAGSLDLEGVNLSEGLICIGSDHSISISQTNPSAPGWVNKIIVSFPGQGEKIPNVSTLSSADLGHVSVPRFQSNWVSCSAIRLIEQVFSSISAGSSTERNWRLRNACSRLFTLKLQSLRSPNSQSRMAAWRPLCAYLDD